MSSSVTRSPMRSPRRNRWLLRLIVLRCSGLGFHPRFRDRLPEGSERVRPADDKQLDDFSIAVTRVEENA